MDLGPPPMIAGTNFEVFSTPIQEAVLESWMILLSPMVWSEMRQTSGCIWYCPPQYRCCREAKVNKTLKGRKIALLIEGIEVFFDDWWQLMVLTNYEYTFQSDSERFLNHCTSWDNPRDYHASSTRMDFNESF